MQYVIGANLWTRPPTFSGIFFPLSVAQYVKIRHLSTIAGQPPAAEYAPAVGDHLDRQVILTLVIFYRASEEKHPFL